MALKSITIKLDGEAYYQAVMDLIEKRRQNGVLLSSYDLVAGASLIYFLTNNQLQMPASWALSSLRDGLLPDGLLEKARWLDKQYQEFSDALLDFEQKAQAMSNAHQHLDEVKLRLDEILKDLGRPVLTVEP